VFQAALIATTWLAVLVPALDKIAGLLADAPRAWAAAVGKLRERWGHPERRVGAADAGA